MAEYADLSIEQMSNYDFSLFGVLTRHDPRTWVTKSGNRIKVEDMTLEHLQNSLNRCTSNNWRVEFIPTLRDEIDKRLKEV